MMQWCQNTMTSSLVGCRVVTTESARSALSTNKKTVRLRVDLQNSYSVRFHSSQHPTTPSTNSRTDRPRPSKRKIGKSTHHVSNIWFQQPFNSCTVTDMHMHIFAGNATEALWSTRRPRIIWCDKYQQTYQEGRLYRIFLENESNWWKTESLCQCRLPLHGNSCFILPIKDYTRFVLRVLSPHTPHLIKQDNNYCTLINFLLVILFWELSHSCILCSAVFVLVSTVYLKRNSSHVVSRRIYRYGVSGVGAREGNASIQPLWKKVRKYMTKERKKVQALFHQMLWFGDMIYGPHRFIVSWNSQLQQCDPFFQKDVHNVQIGSNFRRPLRETEI